MDQSNRNALPPGVEFEGYRIQRVLGAGGFGITYLAIESETGRKVAIKEYLPEAFAYRDSQMLTVRPISSAHEENYQWGLQRFRDEARTLTQFRHTNIVLTLRFFLAHGTAYLVMDYIDGESLGVRLARRGTLPESEIRNLLDPLLNGLEAVHAAGFLHRDIKPDNIFIREDNSQPVLLDFGAARQALGQATHSLTVIVSHGYAPFEQYTSKGEHGAWSDIYAVGATLYRCIVGKPPPTATDRINAILSSRGDPMVPAQRAGATRYGGALLSAVDVALRAQPRERPQNVEAFRDLLSEGAFSWKARKATESTPLRLETLVLPNRGPSFASAEVESFFVQGPELSGGREHHLSRHNIDQLIDELLARELRPNTREDLGTFRQQFAAGKLSSDDARYIRALHARVVGDGAVAKVQEDEGEEDSQAAATPSVDKRSQHDLDRLIVDLLARELRPNTREDLADFRQELVAGALSAEDGRYIRALHARVVDGGLPKVQVNDQDGSALVLKNRVLAVPVAKTQHSPARQSALEGRQTRKWLLRAAGAILGLIAAALVVYKPWNIETGAYDLHVPQESIKFRREIEGGVPILVISGEILNGGSRSVKVTPMRIHLLDKNSQTLRIERVLIDNRTLDSGKRLPFRTSIPNPPPAAAAIRVTFVDQ